MKPAPKEKPPVFKHPGWMYVDGWTPAEIASLHDITVDEVFVWAERIGVTKDQLRRKGLGRGGKTLQDEINDALAQKAA